MPGEVATDARWSWQDYDPLVHEDFDTPHKVFADLRARCPVAHSDAFGGFWIATRYADIRDMLDDPLEYTTTVRNVVPGSSASGRRPPLHLDPPEQTPYRRAIDRALGSSRIRAIEPVIDGHIRRLLKEFIASGGGDFVEAFSSPLPAFLFSDWLQLNEAQTELLWRTSQAFVKAWEAFDVDTVSRTSATLYELAGQLIAERRHRPLDPTYDPVSSLLQERDDDGNLLPDEMLLGCVRQVLVVGLVAPPIFLGSVAVHLARDPELQAFLRANPQHDTAAVEEFLRLYTPYRGFARTSRSGVTLRGRRILPGEPIALSYASANRDEEMFEDPDRFILDRPNIREHLAFGRGPHRCAGMAMARVELQMALRRMLEMSSAIELTGAVRMSGMPEVGPTYVPLRIHPA